MELSVYIAGGFLVFGIGWMLAVFGEPAPFRQLAGGCEAIRRGDRSRRLEVKLLNFGSVTDFTMAFQPIVDIARREIFAHEALVRGAHGEGAAAVFARVEPQERFAFDQACRAKAIEQAAMLGMQSKLSLNVLPRDVCGHEECFQNAMRVAKRFNFPVDRLIFEITEAERTEDIPCLASVFQTYKQHGFTSAIDDFGCRFCRLRTLCGLPARPHQDRHALGPQYSHRSCPSGHREGVCRHL